MIYKKGKVLIMADTLKKMTCPACGKNMEKIFIPSQGINIDICTQGCGGIFFDNREFENFDEEKEDVTKILASLDGKEFIKPSQSMTRVCPNCGSKMVKNHSSINQTIEVDDCYTCGGKFLDHGELEKIRAEYQTVEERDEDIIRHFYKQVGQEMAQVDQRYADTKTDRTLLQKVFYKIIGL